MGATGTGKTTFINLISGSSLRVGKGLHSCTSEVETTLPFELRGRGITLIDTPGFNDTTESDTTILKRISEYLTKQYAEGVKLAGIIYMHRISDFRMGGISTRNFKMFRSLCGDSTLKNVVIVTNMWGEVSREIGEARERELAEDGLFFKSVLDKQGRMVRHDNTIASAQSIIELFSKNEPKALQIQTDIIDEGKDISQTVAAQILNQELIGQARKQEEEKRRVQAELEATMRQQAEMRKAHEEAEQRRMR
ncbi:P-loop containing nucleoside triphosphate hydrolase protein, partial [Collybia nuda]